MTHPRIAAVSCIVALAACTRPPAPAEKAESKAAPTACAANPAWIQTPSQPDFQSDPQSVCAFHQYAWQSFLYLTSPAPAGGLVFEAFASIQDIFGGKPSAKASTFTHAATKRARVFEPRVSKAVEPFDDDQQAGKSRGILVSQSNEITYYEQLMDSAGAGFVKSCDLAVRDCQGQPAAQTLRFPAGAIELKASWLPMSKSHPNAAQFHKIPGFPVKKPNGDTFTPDFMALTGFHLVFATKGHPELIWATFEHIANAPDGPCNPGVGVLPPSPFQGWTFNNVKDVSCQGINAFDPQKPFAIAQVVRNNPFGGGSAENVSDIKSLNASVLALLPQDSVWRNYFLVGAIWTKDGQLPPSASNERGSLQLANATMETFQQDNNCFNCHTNQSSGSGPNQPPFQVSHAFFLANKKPSCSYTAKLPAACQATQPK